jgi:hypothetical protein
MILEYFKTLANLLVTPFIVSIAIDLALFVIGQCFSAAHDSKNTIKSRKTDKNRTKIERIDSKNLGYSNFFQKRKRFL